MSIGKTKENNLGNLDAAIRDARKNIRKLETAIATFEEKKAKGEMWPGSNGTAGTAMESAPAEG